MHDAHSHSGETTQDEGSEGVLFLEEGAKPCSVCMCVGGSLPP